MKRYYHYQINCVFFNTEKKHEKYIVIDAPSKKIAIAELKKANKYRNWDLKWHMTGNPRHYIRWRNDNIYNYDIDKLYNSLY